MGRSKYGKQSKGLNVPSNATPTFGGSKGGVLSKGNKSGGGGGDRNDPYMRFEDNDPIMYPLETVVAIEAGHQTDGESSTIRNSDDGPHAGSGGGCGRGRGDSGSEKAIIQTKTATVTVTYGEK